MSGTEGPTIMLSRNLSWIVQYDILPYKAVQGSVIDMYKDNNNNNNNNIDDNDYEQQRRQQQKYNLREITSAY